MNPAHMQCIAKQFRGAAKHFADDRLVNALLDAHGTSGSNIYSLQKKGPKMTGNGHGSSRLSKMLSK